MFHILVFALFLALPFAYDSSEKFRYYLRFYIYYGYVMVAAVFLIPFMACRPRDVTNLFLAARVCQVVSRVIGLEWKVERLDEKPLDGPCIIVANHQSSLDILGMFQVWNWMGPLTVVAKKELLFAGPFGLAAWLCDLVFIDRMDASAARNIISEAVKHIVPKGTKLWIFPEGTRRNTGEIHSFKKGAFHIAVAAQLPIVPVVFSRYNFLDSQQKTFDPGEIVMSVLPAIQTTGLTSKEVELLMEKTRAAMVETFEKSSYRNFEYKNC